jgi:seryl-tRNA synthetase
MLDIHFIRENKDLVQAGAKKKHVSIDIDALIALDDKRVALLQNVEEMRAKQNIVSDKVGALKAQGGTGGDELIAEMKTLKESLQKKEAELTEVLKEWRALMLSVPNIPDVSVPDGNSDADNVEVKKVGSAPKFSFTPKNHVELMKDLNMVDFEAGTEVAGFRGYFLKNDGALLMFALNQFVVDFFRKKGFEFTVAPSVVRKEGLYGTGYLPQGEEDLYKTQDETYLVGTAEVPTMASFMGKVLTPEELPKKVLAYSPCFRREAGSHGKDTKGIFRVHEFYKFEQVVLCEASHETTVALHEEITQNAEELLQALGLHYHVVINCGADLGLGQVKKYDIEAWVPSENTFRETHSASYFHDFQTRRLNIKYKDATGKSRFAHSLNNTALAIPRIFVPLLEQHQNADGSITIPEALHSYMGKKTITK